MVKASMTSSRWAWSILPGDSAATIVAVDQGLLLTLFDSVILCQLCREWSGAGSHHEIQAL